MQVAPGAWRYALVPALLAVPAAVLFPPAAIVLAVLAAAVVAFHRDPERTPPPVGALAPADGRVSVLREEDGRVRVGVFMNVTDVHVNRAPLAGTVRDVTHEPGGHWPAFSKASERNERLRIDCGEYELALVAGTVARRIYPYVEAGDRLDRGERVGHVSFGSRADVLLPREFGLADVTVSRGDRVRAGETVIADGARD